MTTQSTNLPLTNPSDDTDLRVNEYFETYFSPAITLNQNDYELAKGFFLARTNNVEATAALTSAVINVANELGLYLPDVISQFEATNNLKAAIPMFLNMSRRGTSLLGYTQSLTASENTRRQTAI